MTDALLFLFLIGAAYRVYQFVGVDGLPGVKHARDRLRDEIARRGTTGTWTDGVQWAAGIRCPRGLSVWTTIAEGLR